METKFNKNNYNLMVIKCLYKCSTAAEMGDRLATIDMDRKWGAVPL